MSEQPSNVTDTAPQHAISQPKDRVFFVVWVLVVTICSVITNFLSPEMGNWIGGPLGEWITHFVVALFLLEIPSEIFDYLLYLVGHTIAGLFLGMTTGVVLGVSQWLVLRMRIKGAVMWVVASFVGYTFAGTIGSLVGSIASPFLRNGLITLPYLLFIDAPLTSFVLGIGQWLVLRGKLRNAILWMFLPWLGQVISAVLLFISALFNLPLQVEDTHWILGYSMLIFYEGLSAICSGWLLVWLMSKDARFAKFVQPQSDN
jgi:hypothetical protein